MILTFIKIWFKKFEDEFILKKFKVKHTTLSHHYRNVKSSHTRNKLYGVAMSSVFGKPIRLFCSTIVKFFIFLAKLGELFKSCTLSCKSRAYTNTIHVSQGNSTNIINTIHINEQIQHKCEKEATSVREETELFMCDFYNRLNVIFSCTIETIYFSFFLARVNVPSTLHVKDTHFTVYMVAMIFGVFTTYFAYYMPFSCMITYRRCAQHLGKWVLEEESSANAKLFGKKTKLNDFQQHKQQGNTIVNRWLSSKVYYHGDKVYYMGKVYRVSSRYCAAVPGVSIYENYFRVFINPIRIYVALAFLKILSIFLLIAYMIYNRLWYSVVTNMIESVTNFLSFYMIFRDLFYLFTSANTPLSPFYVSSDFKKCQ